MQKRNYAYDALCGVGYFTLCLIALTFSIIAWPFRTRWSTDALAMLAGFLTGALIVGAMIVTAWMQADAVKAPPVLVPTEVNPWLEVCQQDPDYCDSKLDATKTRLYTSRSN